MNKQRDTQFIRKLEETYSLWVDYLKLSARYKRVFDFLSSEYEKLPALHYYLATSYYQYGEFFCKLDHDERADLTIKGIRWEKGLPDEIRETYNQLKVSFIVFNDIYNDPFEKTWDRICKYQPYILQSHEVYLLEDVLDWLFHVIDFHMLSDSGARHRLEDLLSQEMPIGKQAEEVINLFKSAMHQTISRPGYLYLVADMTPSAKNRKDFHKGQLITGFNKLVEKYTSEKKNLNDPLYTDKEYLFPTTVKQNKKLREYLDVYKRIQSYNPAGESANLTGSQQIELYGWYMERYSKNEDSAPFLNHKGYAATVQQIVSNTEKGEFPGKYDPPTKI